MKKVLYLLLALPLISIAQDKPIGFNIPEISPIYLILINKTEILSERLPYSDVLYYTKVGDTIKNEQWVYSKTLLYFDNGILTSWQD